MISADDIIPMITGHVVMHERPGDPLSGQPIVLCAYLIRHPGAACRAAICSPGSGPSSDCEAFQGGKRQPEPVGPVVGLVADLVARLLDLERRAQPFLGGGEATVPGQEGGAGLR